MKILAIRNYLTTPKFQKNNNPNFIKPIAMKADTVSCAGKINVVTLSGDELALEAKNSKLARRIGICAPEVKSDGTYQTQGKNADFASNPITKSHLKNVFKSIALMEENGIYHGDIEQKHLFYDRKGKVQFDSFRFGEIKSQNKDKYNARIAYLLSEGQGLANLYDYENHCIGEYLRQIGSPQKEKEFIREYLIESSQLHEKMSKSPKISDTHFEELQAKLYQNPDDDIVELVKDRINFKHTERMAFTNWDESASGSSGSVLDEPKALLGVNLYFRAWLESLKYIQKIEEIKTRTQDKDKLELLNYFEQYARHTEKNYEGSIYGMATWRLSEKNPNNVLFKYTSKEKLKEFEEKYQEIKNTDDIKLKCNKVGLIKRFYNNIN